MKYYHVIAFFLLVFAPSPLAAGDRAEQAASDLIARVLPGHADQFIVESIGADRGCDVFEIESREGKIVLRGNNGVSIASALNYYLKNIAQCDVSYGCGNQLNLPASLVPPEKKIRVSSPNKYRYAYNYCTHGYTMAWWDWPQWEREIDFIAMSGVNLALVIEGQEQVWIDALKPLGYSDDEVRAWLVMPSHQPWMYMSNIESYGGPVPRSLVERRLKLGQRIVARMRQLGIEPMLPGYYGMVPPTMRTKFPQAKIIGTGLWCNAKRPDMLYPSDPLYAKIADAYHEAQARHFGPVRFLSADPFHEGSVPGGVDLAECGRNIYSSMRHAHPDVTWVLQAWGNNPLPAMLTGLDKTKLLILDLDCEDHELWRARNAFDGVPYLWCVVLNFGGNNGLDNDLAGFANRYAAAWRDPGRGALSGIGYMCEGTHTMPAVWELFLENAWRKEPVKIDDWLSSYVRRRYGANSAPAQQAWNTLLHLNYGRRSPEQQPFNSVMQGRPSFALNLKAREWASTGPTYAPDDLLSAWESLIAAAPECGPSEGYRYDLTDLTWQVLSDAGSACHREIVSAYKAKDHARVARLSKIMLGLFDDLNTMLATRREFLLGAWLRDARSWGATPQEADLCERNARALVTIWSEPSSGVLRDYSNRAWSGLEKDFYKHRWKIWLAALGGDAPVNEAAVRETIRRWEFDWVKQTSGDFASEPVGDTVAIARALHAKYLPIFRELYGNFDFQPTREMVVGLWEYPAEGTDWLREFRADGSIQSYDRNGVKRNWFDGFAWAIKGKEIVAERRSDGKRMTFRMYDSDHLSFTSENYKATRRVRKPNSPHNGNR
jgi:alpha-N-acetylglucosaminidase